LENVNGSACYGKYFVLECNKSDKSMKNVNPFLVGKLIENLFPKGVYGTRRIGNGNILVHSKAENYATTTVGEHSLSPDLDYKIKVSLHVNLNQSKGKVFCPELNSLTNEEILDELKAEKVIGVRRMMRKNGNGILEGTDTLVLTFDRPQIPDTLLVGYLKLRVSQYYDSPMQCLKCQKYGHTKTRCTETKDICRNCSLELPHTSCGNKKCVNCGQDHASNDSSCEIRRKEQLVTKLMVDKKLSYIAAKKEVEKMSEHSAQNATFSQKVQEQQQAKRNPLPITYEQFTEMMVKMQEMQQQILNLTEQLKMRDELISKLSGSSQKVLVPQQITIAQNINKNNKPTGNGPASNTRSRTNKPKTADRLDRSRSNSRNSKFRRVESVQNSSGTYVSDEVMSEDESFGLPRNIVIHPSTFSQGSTTFNDINN
jgi:hypothetical protein